jgi:hypothetical protein
MEVGVGRAVVERLVGDEVLERDAWWLEVKHAPSRATIDCRRPSARAPATPRCGCPER